jgi:hypothetical protein
MPHVMDLLRCIIDFHCSRGLLTAFLCILSRTN